MGMYHDVQEYNRLNQQLANDMVAFKHKVVQVIANATADPEQGEMPELDEDKFFEELMGGL